MINSRSSTSKPAQRAKQRVVCVGLGAIGSAVAAEVARRPGLELVAAVDPARAGEHVGEIEVTDSVSAIDDVEVDVGLVATGSSVPQFAEDVKPLIAQGIDVVTSCEELVYPWLRHKEVAESLDELARSTGATVVGTGVNPGFIMDVLPVLTASACLGCREIEVSRHVDLSRRRPQLREKLGAGLAEDSWHERNSANGGLGHAGLVESAVLCAVGAGWSSQSERFERGPVVADGVAIGIREIAEVEGIGGGTVRLELVFQLDGKDVDRVEIRGETPVDLTLEGVHGDQATVARLVHAAEVVGGIGPGLRLPLELPGWTS